MGQGGLQTSSRSFGDGCASAWAHRGHGAVLLPWPGQPCSGRQIWGLSRPRAPPPCCWKPDPPHPSLRGAVTSKMSPGCPQEPPSSTWCLCSHSSVAFPNPPSQIHPPTRARPCRGPGLALTVPARPLREPGHSLGQGPRRGKCPRPAGTYLPPKAPCCKNSKWPV